MGVHQVCQTCSATWPTAATTSFAVYSQGQLLLNASCTAQGTFQQQPLLTLTLVAPQQCKLHHGMHQTGQSAYRTHNRHH